MRRTLSTLVIIFALGAPAWAAEPDASGGTPDTDKTLAEFRADVQAKRTDVLAKNLTLSAEQAAKFWPMFDQFQTEQNKIIDEQLKSIQKYAETYETLSDKDAVGFINSQLDRDNKMHSLQVSWLAKFRKLLGDKMGARVIQIDRRLSQLAQVVVSTQMPLVR